MLNALTKIHDERQRLRRATGMFWHSGHASESPMLIGVVLGFDRTHVAVSANDDDSVSVSCASSDTMHDGVAKDISRNEPWKTAIGKPLLWSWSLTNQQGYTDGVQFEFAHDVDGESTLIQLVIVAGEVKMRAIPAGFLD